MIKPVKDTNDIIRWTICHKEFGMLGCCSAVSSNIDIEPLLRGDKPKIFALCLSALPNTTRYTAFNLVRSADTCKLTLQEINDIPLYLSSKRIASPTLSPMPYLHHVVPTQLLTVRKLLAYACPDSIPAAFNCPQINGRSPFLAPNMSIRCPPVILVYKLYF